ncbi:hypothetical protein JW872_00150 [Candidatus Babeliales bacterium]|nr:hypothetical protein [Candidatus Babeliales bacterium]
MKLSQHNTLISICLLLWFPSVYVLDDADRIAQETQTRTESLKHFVNAFYDYAQSRHFTNQLPEEFLTYRELLNSPEMTVLTEEELQTIIEDIYCDAEAYNAENILPEPFIACYESLQCAPHAVTKGDMIIALQSLIQTIQKLPTRSDSLRLGVIEQKLHQLHLLVSDRFGNITQGACAGSVLGILGDACTHLGTSISEALAGTFTSIDAGFNNTYTTLHEMTTIMNEGFNGTYTMIGDVSQPASANTVLGVLGDADTYLGTSISEAISGTFTILDSLDLNPIYTTLGDVGNILGPDATISGTLRDIVDLLDSATISTSNSTSTPLAGGSIFTGTGEDVSNYATISISVYSDVESAANGLSLQQSNDNTNWDFIKTFTVSAAIPQEHIFPVTARYYRVVYTNGSSAQSAFRLQSMYHVSKNKSTTLSITNTITKNADTQLVRISNDFRCDTGLGLISGKESNYKFAHYESLTTSFADIWTNGGTYPWPTTASRVRVAAGGNAADTAGGANAQKIMVVGLDNNFNPISEEITLAGATESSYTTQSFRRIYRAYITSVGTYGATNAGIITIQNETPATLAVIGFSGIGFGQTLMSMYTVPAGKTMFLSQANAYVASSKTARLIFWKRENAGNTSSPIGAKRIMLEAYGVQGSANFATQIRIPEKTDVWWSGIAEAAGTEVSVDYNFILADNN